MQFIYFFNYKIMTEVKLNNIHIPQKFATNWQPQVINLSTVGVPRPLTTVRNGNKKVKLR